VTPRPVGSCPAVGPDAWQLDVRYAIPSPANEPNQAPTLEAAGHDQAALGLTERDVPGRAAATGHISGTHSYAKPDDYPVAVTVDDGAQSAATTTTVHVTAR
jgi:hypothetical protein